MRAIRGNQRLHVELQIYWSPTNVLNTWALVDTGIECTLTRSNPQKYHCEAKQEKESTSSSEAETKLHLRQNLPGCPREDRAVLPNGGFS